MSDSTYLLYTENFPASRLEILILGGNIINKISNRVFVAILPSSVYKEDLNYSTFTQPKNLDIETLRIIKEFEKNLSRPLREKGLLGFHRS